MCACGFCGAAGELTSALRTVLVGIPWVKKEVDGLTNCDDLLGSCMMVGNGVWEMDDRGGSDI